MKKIFIGALLLFTPFLSNAQGERSIGEGDVLINPGITLGWYTYNYGLDRVNFIPPVSLNFEYAATEFLSFGLEAEYARRSYQEYFFVAGGNQYDYTYKTFAFRGSFHYLDFIKSHLEDKIGDFNSDKLDFYISATVGTVITQSTQRWDAGNGREHLKKDFNSGLQVGYMAGFRYYFSNNFGAFLETGKNNLGWAKVGLTLKF